MNASLSEPFYFDVEQETVHALIQLMWPNENVERCGLALAEEAGEVARAILKREHQRDGDGDRGGERDWTANLRKEVAQVVITCMSLAEREGFSLRDAILEEMQSLDERREALGLDWFSS